MLLCIDTGNTNICFGVMDKDCLKSSFRLQTKDVDSVESIIDALEDAVDIDGAILSSVVPKVNQYIIEAVKNKYNIDTLVVDYKTDTGLIIDIVNPQSTGADLIVDCVAGYNKYKGECLIVDCGTASKFLYVDNDGHFKYGAIAPGLKLSAQTLWNNTALLPEIELKVPDSILANETIDCMQAGIMYGYVGLCKELISQYKKEIGHDFPIIATGGLTGRLIEDLPEINDFDPNLAFVGMKIIYERNK